MNKLHTFYMTFRHFIIIAYIVYGMRILKHRNVGKFRSAS